MTLETIAREELTAESQNRQIRRDLLKGYVISPISALNDYKCFRLSARIWDLRHREGLPIKTKVGTSHPNSKKTFALYYISEEDRKTILEKEKQK